MKREPHELSIFDFGMGWGKWSLMVKAFGCESFGTEISQSRINYATSNGIKVIPYDRIKDYQFDFINAEQVFEHIPEPLETLKYLTKGLKNGGVIKISVPNGWRIKSVLSKMNWRAKKWSKDSLNIVAPLEHINCFKQKSLEIMAAQAQLKAIKFKIKFIPTGHSKSRNILAWIVELLRPLYYYFLRVTGQSTYLFFEKT